MTPIHEAGLCRAGTIEFVGGGRKVETLEKFYETFSPEQRSGIRAISLVMWDPFSQVTLRHVLEASKKIVFDCFHIMGYVGKAVDTVRKKEYLDGRAPELKAPSTSGCTRRRTFRPPRETALRFSVS